MGVLVVSPLLASPDEKHLQPLEATVLEAEDGVREEQGTLASEFPGLLESDACEPERRDEARIRWIVRLLEPLFLTNDITSPQSRSIQPRSGAPSGHRAQGAAEEKSTPETLTFKARFDPGFRRR